MASGWLVYCVPPREQCFCCLLSIRLRNKRNKQIRVAPLCELHNFLIKIRFRFLNDSVLVNIPCNGESLAPVFPLLATALVVNAGT